MNTVAYHTERRRPSVRFRLMLMARSLDPERIPHAADGVNQLVRERLVYSIAQPRHQHVDDIGTWIEVVTPHVRQDHRLRDDLAGVAHQVLEQGELARAKLDRLAAPL